MQNSDGSTLKHRKYYAVPILIDESPDRIILHGECNDVSDKNSIPEKIANEIGDMAILCRGYGVNDVFISAMICRRGKFLNEKIKRINILLKQNQRLNTEIRDLGKDGIHLLESGKKKLIQNFK